MRHRELNVSIQLLLRSLGFFFFNLEFKVLYNYFCAMKGDILAGRDIFFDVQGLVLW